MTYQPDLRKQYRLQAVQSGCAFSLCRCEITLLGLAAKLRKGQLRQEQAADRLMVEASHLHKLAVAIIDTE